MIKLVASNDNDQLRNEDVTMFEYPTAEEYADELMAYLSEHDKESNWNHETTPDEMVIFHNDKSDKKLAVRINVTEGEINQWSFNYEGDSMWIDLIGYDDGEEITLESQEYQSIEESLKDVGECLIYLMHH